MTNTADTLRSNNAFSVLKDLAPLHTFGLNAHCFRFMTIDTLDSLVQVLDILRHKPFLFLGEGSNTVFTSDYEGFLLKNELKGIQVFDDDEFYHLNVASGENWHDLVCFCMDKQIYGFENLALIPGTVGASPIQNIGAYGVEVERFVHSVEFIDINSGLMGHFTNKECEFAYRDSRFKRQADIPRVITSVNFSLPKQNKLVTSYGPLSQLTSATPESVFNKVVEIRTSKLPDPSVLGNAGSFFKNPCIEMEAFLSLQAKYSDIPHFGAPGGKVKIPAAWLIDTLGYKGKKYGDIACHEKQALVLVNHGEGKGEDLVALAKDIKENVHATFGIDLENEVRIMGRSGLISL